MRCIRYGLWFFAIAASGVTSANAQDVAMADRAPRFWASAPTGPVRVDVNRTAVLRQRISLTLRGVSLGEALKAITHASGLRLGYSKSVVPVNRIVRLVAEDITVAGALSTVLFDTGVDVLFSGNQAALVKRGTTQIGAIGTIVGRVTAKEAGVPIAGVTVTIVGTSWRAETSDSGTYVLDKVPAGEYQIAVRYIGYQPATQKVVVDSTTIRVDFALQALAQRMNEIVSTPTGLHRRRDLGNAITTIDADSVMQTAPIRNLTDLLENRVPGLTMQRTSGAPGDPARLRLRGIGSVMRGNDPIVIVDGVRIYSAQSEARSGNLTNLGCVGMTTSGGATRCPAAGSAFDTTPQLPAPSPLDQIDPNTIDKIEVFKGPSAATLYGPDAANGVIVVTTKRGRPGPTRWDANVRHGRTTTPGRWPEGYYRFGHDSSSGALAICPLIATACVTDSLVRFQALNDPRTTILGEGQHTEFSLRAYGGNQGLTYSITGTYADEVGLLTLPTLEIEQFRARLNREVPDWMRRPHHLKTWNVSSSVTALLGSTADVTLTTALGRSEQQRTDLEQKVSGVASTFINPLNGLYYPLGGPLQIGEGFNASGILLLNNNVPAVSTLFQAYYTRTTASAITLTNSLSGSWRPRPWLNVISQASLDIKPRIDERFLPTGLISSADSGMLIRGTGRSVVGGFNLQGTMTRRLPKGFRFETSVGTNITTFNTTDLVSSATKLVAGTSSLSGARIVTATESQSRTSVFGWYIEPRIVGQRLSLSTGLRLDGGSSHGTRITGSGGNLLSLPKLNGSWVISEEPFFPFKSLFSSLRLRGAYGQAQVQPSPTDRLRLYTGQVENQLWLKHLGNTEVRPERSVEFEGGVDADLLDSRVSVGLTAYQKTQVDALMPVELPPSVNGGGSTVRNIGNIRNRGLELEVEVTPVQMPALTWSTSLIYSRNTNTLVRLGKGVDADPSRGIVEGYPIGSRWAKPILGYADQNGNGVLDRNEIQVGDSLVFLGQLQPNYMTALQTKVMLFGGAMGITAGFSYQSGAMQIDQTARTNWILTRGALDPTAPFNEQAAVLASTTDNMGLLPSTDYGLVQEISTFRFESFSVNYRAPRGISRLVRAQGLTVGLQGSNLALHSTYRGKDPNVNSWSVGESIVDTGQLPSPRRWQLALQLHY